MAKKFVIPRRRIPKNLPINQTLIVLLLLKVFELPTWCWWTAGIVMGLIWVAVGILITNEQEKEIYNGE